MFLATLALAACTAPLLQATPEQVTGDQPAVATAAPQADPQDSLALAKVQQYVGGEPAASLAALEAWYKENEPYLFFTDRGGYGWMVDTNAKRAAAVSASATKPAEAGARRER